MARKRQKRSASKAVAVTAQVAEPTPAARDTGLSNPELWFVDFLRGALSGPEVNAVTALTIPAYWACVRLISSDVASLPLRPVRLLDSGGSETAHEHPAYRIVHAEANPELTKINCFETWISHALIYHAGYLEIQRDGAGRPAALWNIDPTRTRPVRDQERRLWYETQDHQGRPIYLRPEDVLVLHGLGYSGLVGYALSRLTSDALASSIGALKANAKLWENGVVPSGHFTHPGRMTEKALEHLRRAIADRYVGAENAWRPIILEEGMKFESSGFSPEDAQLIEALRHGVENVARLFGVPLYKLQHMQGTTFASVDALAVDYLQALLPWIVRIEQELDRKLVTSPERGKIVFKHNVRGLLRGDLAAQSAFYREMINCGAYCINEVRAFEDLPPIAGGDTYFVPSTMVPLERAADPARNTPVALPPPASPSPEDPDAESPSETDDESD